MGDLAVESYKKSVATVVDRWEKKSRPVAEAIDKINVELKKLQANKTPTAEEKAKIDSCIANRTKLKAQLENFGNELRINLMVITPPEKNKANEKDMIQLPKALEDIVKKKGISIGSVTIKPDIGIDLKSFKFKKAGIILEVKF